MCVSFLIPSIGFATNRLLPRGHTDARSYLLVALLFHESVSRGVVCG